MCWGADVGAGVPQTELSVTRGIGVPVGERGHPLLQPRALDNEVGERGLRHDGRICGGGGKEEPRYRLVVLRRYGLFEVDVDVDKAGRHGVSRLNRLLIGQSPNLLAQH